MVNANRTILAGMSVGVLEAQLATMQQAYLDLSTGAKGESYSYTQGDGSKSVTYTRASLPALVQAILAVQSQIDLLSGHRHGRRRAMNVRF
ncbi:MAG TPA: gpW family head-tail joining protein [Patescibacteria group bacterium]|nr:gpW family head-tail joining protein [Patescibacteria group bacterium]